MPNAWDAGSALVLAAVGFPAIATTSGGIAFSLGKPDYGPEQIKQQKQAIYDAGYNGWIFWHPGSNYEVFLPGLERSKPCRFTFGAVDSTRVLSSRCS